MNIRIDCKKLYEQQFDQFFSDSDMSSGLRQYRVEEGEETKGKIKPELTKEDFKKWKSALNLSKN